jgi:hypothetical protein
VAISTEFDPNRVDKYLLAYKHMVSEIQSFVSLSARTEAQQELLDLLESAERGPALGLDPTLVIQELTKKYKEWKCEQNKPQAVERGLYPKWPFVDPGSAQVLGGSPGQPLELPPETEFEAESSSARALPEN